MNSGLIIVFLILFVLTLLLFPVLGSEGSTSRKKNKKDKPVFDPPVIKKSTPIPPPPAVPPIEGQITRDFKNNGRAELKNLQFGHRSDYIMAESREILQEVAGILKNEPGLKLFIEGTSNGNAGLAQRRAAGVLNFLINEHGIAPARLNSGGRVTGPGANPSDKQRNRRVEIIRLD